MNCAECKELLVAYIEGLLDESQKKTITEHLNDCRTCRAEVKQLTKLQDRLARNGNTLAQKNLEDDVMNKILQQQNTMLKAALKAGKGLKLRRFIMKSRIAKLAAAAVIIIGACLVINFYMGTGSRVALAGVLEKIEQVQAFMYRMKMTATGNMMPNMPTGKQEIETTVIISNEYGMKMDAAMTMTDANAGRQFMTQQMYIIPDQKIMLMVMPEQKKYSRMEFDDDLLDRMKKQNNDPREMIKQILNCEYTELGRSVIDGIEVDGFQTTDPAFAGGAMENVKLTLWVDVENWLPVRAEMEFRMSEQMQMSGTMYDFQWDIQVDKSEFEPVIPEDYTAFPTDGMKMPSISEEATIEGLKFFAEMSGRYPKNLNLMNLIQEFNKFQEFQTPVAKQFQQELRQLRSDEERAAKMMDIIKPIQSIGIFYMTLVQERKDPAYYGESIGPDDVNAVLLRWKETEDNYRVVFSDLSTLDVTAGELAELENLPLQQ